MKRKAFTLLEILIATAIFATVMILTTGVVAESAGYQGKLKAFRSASEESRRLADMITNDIHSANTEGTVKADFGSGQSSFIFKDGIAILACSNSPTCTVYGFRHYRKYKSILASGNQYYPSDYNNRLSTSNGDTIVIFHKKDGGNVIAKVYMVYRSSSSNPYKVYYKEFSGSSFDLGATNLATLRSNTSVISSSENEVRITFGGYAGGYCDPNVASPCTAVRPSDLYKMQSYVFLNINAKTLNFSTLGPNNRAETNINTMVTARTENNVFN